MPFAIERNDLSTVAADAIVVAANEHLQITGGVGLTVALAAGLEQLQRACDKIGFCPCGSAVATPAFNLPAKTVVHAVGPVWQGGKLGEADFLRSAYDAALECAVSEGARSIALPLISAGSYKFPADVSLAVARESIRGFLNRHDDVDVRLVLYSRESVAAGMASYLDIAEYVDDHYVDDHPAWATTVLNAPNAMGAPSRLNADSQTEDPYLLEEGRHTEAPISRPTPAPKQSALGPLGRIGHALAERRKEQLGDDARPPERPTDATPAAAGPILDSAGDAQAIYPPCGEAATAPTFGITGAPALQESVGSTSLDELLDSLDAPFSTTLLALIDERGMTDSQVYKRANISRQLFSKIRSDADYRPTKKTALALAVALGLDLDETNALLARAGFALSSSSKADVIVEYFIGQGNHDIFEINEALYAFDQPLL